MDYPNNGDSFFDPLALFPVDANVITTDPAPPLSTEGIHDPMAFPNACMGKRPCVSAIPEGTDYSKPTLHRGTGKKIVCGQQFFENVLRVILSGISAIRTVLLCETI